MRPAREICRVSRSEQKGKMNFFSNLFRRKEHVQLVVRDEDDFKIKLCLHLQFNQCPCGGKWNIVKMFWGRTKCPVICGCDSCGKVKDFVFHPRRVM